jgi:uncharacterized protein
MALQPLLRWRMRRAETGQNIYGGIYRFSRDNPDYVAAVLAEIARRGPLSASELDDAGERTGPWWGWHKGKTALEYLFWSGKVTTAYRRGFERVYDLTERVLPPAVLNLPSPEEPDAIRELALIGARAHGVASEIEIRDYFRLPVAEARQAIAELVEAGALLRADIEGWRHPAFLDPSAAMPARMVPTALLSPFDPLVWNRDRTERLFDFHYRLEFYTPGHKRNFGYFVMPFLYRGRIEARVDLKADRAARALLVQGVFAEARIRRHDGLVEGLAVELRHLARWLDLDNVIVKAVGPLPEMLRIALQN